jgi:hypothetical protein
MKIKRTLVPLCLAIGLVVGSLGLSFVVKSPSVEMAVTALHFPAGMLAFFILPDQVFTKNGNPSLYLTVAIILALMQWYLIFAGVMWLRRRLSTTEGSR